MVAAAAVMAVKIVTAFTTLLVIASPSVALARVVKAKTIGDVSVLPLLLLLCSSHLWMMYGAIANLIFPVFSLFVVGEVAALVYITTYWWYAGNQRPMVVRRAALVVGTLSVLTVYAVLGALGFTNQSHDGVVITMGLMADAALVLLYGAPMEKIASVLKTRSAACIQVPMVLAGTMNNCAWLSYGIVTSNWLIIGPNCLFITIHALQIGLCIVFRNHKQPDEQSKLETAVEIATEASDEIEIVTDVSDEESSHDNEFDIEVKSPVTGRFETLASPTTRGTRV